jgi:UDP-N-acetylglucosamine--N-acetylmuramyl-(pentapeptide) pyrophosphoryl-undecaprenol N-acetylglucosamine transferase
MITGGSNGAQAINQAMAQFLPALLEQRPKLHVIHQVGHGKEGVYAGFKHDRLAVMPLLKDMHRYSGAADVIVTRAGANTMAEFGVQGKACIVVPNPLLTGGHQLKNAEHLAGQNAIVVVDEATMVAEQGSSLRDAVINLLQDPGKRQQLGVALQSMAITDAAEQLANLLVQVAQPEQGKANN